MKKSILSLLICAAVTCSAHAATLPQAELAQEGISYAAIIVTLKPGADASPTAARKLTLSDPSLVLTPMFQADKSVELSELNARYGFDRYLRVMLPAGLTHQCLYFEQPHTFEQILFIQTAEPALVGHA